MAYGVKFRVAYMRLGGGTTTIDILENGYASSVTDLTAGSDPLTINFNANPENIYEPTIGSGATIRVSATPLALLGLFTNDPLKYAVKVYNGATGTTLVWQGYVNAEIYTEDYSSSMNVDIAIQCNDGMQLLDNLIYSDADDTTLANIVTLGDVMNNVFDKLTGLTYTYIYTSNDISVASGTTNIFTQLKVANANFTDENAEPMTCRQALESVVGGLGLVCRFKAGDIYIYDPFNLRDTAKGKRYTYSGFTETTSAFGGYLDISAGSIKWFETGMSLDIVPAVCEAVVKYDPYNFIDKAYDFSDSENWSTVGTFNILSGYHLNDTIEYADWTYTGTNYMPVAVRETTYGKPEYILMLNSGQTVAKHIFAGSSIVMDNSMLVRLSMDVWIQTKSADANIWSTGAKNDVQRVKLPIALKVGTKFWKGDITWNTVDDSTKWQPISIFGSDLEADYATSTCNDKWINAKIDIPVFTPADASLLSGEVSVEILDDLVGRFTNQVEPSTEAVFNTTTGDININSSTFDATFTRDSDTQMRCTLVGFKTAAGISSECDLFDNAVKSITCSLAVGGTAVNGTWHTIGDVSTGYTSTKAQTTFSVVSYTKSNDTLIFTMSTSGTAYFGVGFNHINTAYTYSLNYNYDYKSTVLLIKNVKIELVEQASREVISNSGAESKGFISSTLTGKGAFTINTTTGTGTRGNSRGALKASTTTPAWSNITGLYRGATISTPNLILQALVSQYSSPRFKLSGNLNVYGLYPDVNFKLIQDGDYLHDSGVHKSFYIIGSNYNDRDESAQVDMIEITTARDTF